MDLKVFFVWLTKDSFDIQWYTNTNTNTWQTHNYPYNYTHNDARANTHIEWHVHSKELQFFECLWSPVCISFHII